MTANTKSQVSDRERHGATVAAARARTMRGHSLIEMLCVVALIGLLSSLALPQLLVQRRLSRSVAVTREIMATLRHTRQLAMSQRQAFTFQYNNTTKQVSIIDHNSNTGAAMLLDPSYPNTAGSQVVSATPLAADASLSSEITYGIPSGAPAGALADGISLTALLNSQINITFQPDGSVIDGAGNPVGRAMYIYNNRAAQATAAAISVIGASGRVKIWRYDAVANVYAE
jgi:prepilin-type N-terminal cleavage/methylation domain-containing protein